MKVLRSKNEGEAVQEPRTDWRKRGGRGRTNLGEKQEERRRKKGGKGVGDCGEEGKGVRARR